MGLYIPGPGALVYCWAFPDGNPYRSMVWFTSSEAAGLCPGQAACLYLSDALGCQSRPVGYLAPDKPTGCEISHGWK